MVLAAVSESIALVGAVTGIVTGVVSTAVTLLSYRRQTAQAPPAASALPPATGTPAPAGAPVATPGRRRSLQVSLKGALAGLLGIVAAFYAGLVSLAASMGEDPQAVAGGVFLMSIAALALGVMARRDIKRHPERRGKLVANLGIATAVVALLVASAASETEPTPEPLEPVTIEPRETSVNQSLSGSPAAAAKFVAQQIQPQLEAQLQARFPDVVVTVDGVECSGASGGGTCIAQARDSAGGSQVVSIEYKVVDPATGAFVWQTR